MNDEAALVYCPKCGHDFDSKELAQARSAIGALAALRDAQAEQIQQLIAVLSQEMPTDE